MFPTTSARVVVSPGESVAVSVALRSPSAVISMVGESVPPAPEVTTFDTVYSTLTLLGVTDTASLRSMDNVEVFGVGVPPPSTQDSMAVPWLLADWSVFRSDSDNPPST